MLVKEIKNALRIKNDAFDDEISDLADDCLKELTGLGIYHGDDVDNQVKTCVIAYCKWKFGSNDDAERWEHIYHDKVTKLQAMTGYGFPAESGG
jgi:hypothetical protein